MNECISIYIYLFMNENIYIYICEWICIYIYMNECIYIHIYIYIIVMQWDVYEPDPAIYSCPLPQGYKMCVQYPQDMGKIWQNLFHGCRSSMSRPLNLSISPSSPKSTGRGKNCSIKLQDFGLCDRNDTSSCTVQVDFELNSGWWSFGHDSTSSFFVSVCVAWGHHDSSSTVSLWGSTLGASMTGMMPTVSKWPKTDV